MINLRRIILAIISCLLIFSCFGCNEYVVKTGELSEDYIPNPEGKIKLQYYIASTESDKRSVNDWVASFIKKYPDVTVETDISNRGTSAIDAEIAARSLGDVFFMDETQVYNYAVIQKVLMPLDGYLEKYEIDTSNVFAAIYEMGVVRGRLYLAMRDYNHISLIYNKDAIKSANLVDPVELESQDAWTWDTFKQYCEALTTQDEEADVKQVGASLMLGYSADYIPFLEGWGGSWYDTVEKKVSFISDERVLQGVKEMVNVIESNTVRYSATDIYGIGASTIQASASQKDFTGYKSVFNDLVFISMASQGKSYDAQGIDWDVVSWPAFPTHKVGTGATGFGVYNGTKNPDAAAALVLSLYTEDGQKAYNGQEGGSVPNVRSLANASFWRVPYADRNDDPVNGKNYYAFVSYPEADTYARPECVIPPDVSDIVTKYMQNVVPNAINGKMSVEDTLTKMETEANEKWATLYD